MSNFDALVTKLREIFQIDRPELDFGIYRILNARAGEIDLYLTTRLKQQVSDAFTSGAAANTDALAKELTDKIAQYEADGVNPATVPAVQKLREALAAASTGASEHESQVFSHLLTFFSRYYDKGDFISQRRYKGDTYAIPYSGEEVVLHWANKDQYYTKSGEAFSNYGFKLEDGRLVQFRLVAADTAKDNRKDNDKERRFILAEVRTVDRIDDDGETYLDTIVPISEEDGNLIIRFDYKAMPKGTKQDALVTQAVAAVLSDETVKARWLGLTERAPTDSNPQRTILEKCLTNYTNKNTADYFIHKNLGGFLRQELDFYIKNEVMNLDDVQNAAAFAAIEKSLRMIQCLRSIALNLISFLASIEDFQKKLWLKKKFVVSAHYCVTLDRVPEALHLKIAANPAQWAQWQELGMRGSALPCTVEELKTSPYLMVDTALFDAVFRADLLKAIPDLDANTDGLLVHGDNFQALTLLTERYREKVKCIYIDPPYNSPSSEIAYKNSFKHSSWLTLMSNRIDRSAALQTQDGGLVVAIDKYEQNGLERILNDRFNDRIITSIPVEHNRKGVQGDGFSYTNEYAVFVTSRNKGAVNRFSLPEAEWEYQNLRNWGGESDRADGKTCFYPIFVRGSEICGFGPVPDDDFHPDRANIKQPSGTIAIWPIDASGVEKKWRYARDTVEGILSLLKVETARNGDLHVMKAKADAPYKTMWYATKYNAGDHGTKILTNMGFAPGQFDFPKSIHTVSDCISAVSHDGSLVLDYFAGSGTTAHAVIKLNRESRGSRKYALVEQGPYFDTVVKPRIQKVVYSSDWRDGQPTAPESGISHAFKVLKIESYEDTLNNLNLRRDERQGALLNAMTAEAQDNYLMQYMLDVEARGSLLSVEDFRKPFDYTLNIAVDSAGAYETRKVDLVETFNYLIGLTVRNIDIQLKQGFVTVEGTLPTGEKTLVLWRDCDMLDYEGLTRLRDKLAINPADNEYEVVYINGDHNIPSVVETTEEEGSISKKLMLRQIESAFLDAMFKVDDV